MTVTSASFQGTESDAMVARFKSAGSDVLQGANLHAFVRSYGLVGAQALATNKLERWCIDIIGKGDVPEADNDILFVLPLVTALPKKSGQNLTEWHQETFDGLRCHWKCGVNGESAGLPAGPRGRRILIYIINEALRGSDRLTPSDPSMYHWSHRLTDWSSGGRTYAGIRRLHSALASSELIVSYRDKNQTWCDVSIRWPDFREPLDEAVWRQLNALIEKHFRSRLAKLRRSALIKMSRNSYAIDIYIWLASVLPFLDLPLSVEWDCLWQQFGAGYNRRDQWIAVFRPALLQTLTLYPSACVSLSPEGMILYPSAGPFTVCMDGK